uniref:G-protein coupled receptors family 1 profile domain-containing protein n=1 Tax=Plectus sambesii TaxID=2011161 RepID=A0A914UX01_9BILA
MHHRQFGLFFAVLGTFASLCNVFIIIVFNSNKALRSRSQFFVALAAGDIIFGLGFVLTTVHNNNEHQAVNQSNTVLSCWLQLHWICVQVGPWLAMTMTLALTLERAAAVFLPYCLIPIDSASNLFLYVWLKRLFRLQAKRVLCMLFRGSDQRNAPQLPMNFSDSLLTNIKTGPSMTELLVSTTL